MSGQRQCASLLVLTGVVFLLVSGPRPAVERCDAAGITFPSAVADDRCQASAAPRRDSGLVADIELSPCMAGGPVARCIYFQLFEDCVAEPIDFQQEVTFTGGLALGVAIPVSGTYLCATARDPLHTLRSVSDVRFDGAQYSVSFVGDPSEENGWLIGGNLDFFYLGGNPDVIDILDFGTFMFQVSQGAAYPDGDTSCGTPYPHGDINADGMVDVLDYAFIAENFVSQSKEGCCADGSREPPIVDITIVQLNALGMSELGVADLNGDDHVNIEDMQVYLQEGYAGTRMATAGARPLKLGHNLEQRAPSFSQSDCQLDPSAHDGPVNLEWSPSPQTTLVGNTVQISLQATSGDGLDHNLTALDLVITWDPNVLQLIGREDPCDSAPAECALCMYDADCPPGVYCYCPEGPPCTDFSGVCASGKYDWWLSAFPTGNSDPDGLNETWDDGDALYRAHVPLNQPLAPVLAQQPLSVTELRFATQSVTAPLTTPVHLAPVAGSTPTYTRVLGEMPGHLLTGTLGSAVIMTKCFDPAQCFDGDLCTDDTCAINGYCLNPPNYAVAIYCCDPSTGEILAIDDDQPCTKDTCDPQTGQVAHQQLAVGSPCVDGNICTVEDVCDDYGVCAGVDITDIECADDADCFGLTCEKDEGFCICEPLVNPPLPAPPPHNARKNRYISFAPNNTASTAFHVRIMDCEHFPNSIGVEGWVGEADENGISRLVDDPFFDQAWPAVVHLGDCEIVPTGRYELRATLDEIVFSDGTEVGTILDPDPKEWGDVVGQFSSGAWLSPDGTVNMDDVLAVIQKFLYHPSAPPLTWVDLDGEVPNKIVNFTDIQQAVLAFQARAYPFSPPACCP